MQAEQPHSDSAPEAIEDDEEISEDAAFNEEDERLYGHLFSKQSAGQEEQPISEAEGEEGSYNTDDFSDEDAAPEVLLTV